MEKFLKYFMIVLFASAVFVTGCSDDDDDNPNPTTPTTTTYDLLTDYLVSNNMDVDIVLGEWITSAESIFNGGLENFHIIDIRGEADYNDGHIEGAINSTLGGILAAAEGSTKPIIVVCYTGQTAGHAVMALRLSGYADAKVLKWGMSGWNNATSGPWAGNTGDAAIGNASWIPAPGSLKASEEYALPTIESTSTDGATILAERVAYMLENGFKGVANSAVLDNPANYFINNFWALSDVEHYGHISGAYRIQPFTLAAGNDKNLDPSKQVVTYCWTGQTSSMMTAYLTVLGYDAASLKFGANGMIFSNLESHQYTVPADDYPLVTK